MNGAILNQSVSGISANGAKISYGSYIGDGNASGKTVDLGFSPIAVIIYPKEIDYRRPTEKGITLIKNASVYDGDQLYMGITDTGFFVRELPEGYRPDLNFKDTTYYYVAFY